MAVTGIAEGVEVAGRYTVRRVLGRGGMATVYLARDARHRRDVALKVLRSELASGLAAERFLREVEVAASLTHPNILPLHDSGREGDALYYVMPFIAGETLRARLARDGRVPAGEALRLAAEIAEALDHAHRRGVVHRDVKPENVLLCEGHALVMDFGIAHAVREAGGERLTESGVMIGTPAYMSPEQAGGERAIDGRSDVFALGALLYEALTGRAPFAAPTVTATIARVLAEDPPPPSRDVAVPPSVDEVVRRALAKAPEMRFATTADMAAALRAADAGTTRERTVAVRRAAPARRRGLAAGALAAALAVLALAFPAGRGGARAATPSLAVLPFRNAASDTAEAYFSSGIGAELFTALSDVPGLAVAAQGAEASLGAAAADPREVGRRLGVSAVLAGSVRRDGRRVRVSATLADAESGRQLWAQSYDRELSDIFAVQEDIARAIVGALRVRLAAGDDVLVRRRTASVEAHDLVLRARNAKPLTSRAGLLEAVELLRRAVALDSSYAAAHAELALTYQALAVFRDQERTAGGEGMSAGEMLRLARIEAQRAYALDSLSADANSALGLLLFRHDWDWAAAERHLRRGVALNPSAPAVHLRYSRFLRSMGRFEEARGRLALARELAPAGPDGDGVAQGRISYFEGDFPRAVRETRSAAPLGRRVYYPWLAQTLVAAGDRAEAERLLVRAPPAEATWRLTHALARAVAGDSAGARQRLRAIEEAGDFYSTSAAGVLVALGDTAAALARIRRAIDTRDPLVVDLAVDPWLRPLRGNAEFRAILRRLRLPILP